MNEIKQIFNNVEEVVEEVKSDEPVVEPIPLITDSNWSEYVMKHFEEDELIDGNPTTEGLRRVAQLLLGEIVESYPTPMSWPTSENPCSATVMYTILIDWRLGGSSHLRDFRKFAEIADVNEFNTEDIYRKHASATASTRAEGRALRKALKLKHIIAAEEKDTQEQAENQHAAPIASGQINVINMLCRKYNVDVMKYINSGALKYDSIDDVPYEKAANMVSRLNEFGAKKKEVPESIIGYKPDWRK